MQDHELKALLLETCPIRPGQESRAWDSLKARLARPERSGWSWLYLPAWRSAAIAVAALVIIPVVGTLIWGNTQPQSLATADSRSPGIFATAYYSSSAGAQVILLKGMGRATDKLTYLDPTTDVGDAPRTQAPAPTGDPNSL